MSNDKLSKEQVEKLRKDFNQRKPDVTISIYESKETGTVGLQMSFKDGVNKDPEDLNVAEKFAMLLVRIAQEELASGGVTPSGAVGEGVLSSLAEQALKSDVKTAKVRDAIDEELTSLGINPDSFNNKDIH